MLNSSWGDSENLDCLLNERETAVGSAFRTNVPFMESGKSGRAGRISYRDAAIKYMFFYLFNYCGRTGHYGIIVLTAA